ncbi:MAG TPA: hypothetical protein VKH42_02935 [Vicinamibacterales bacterium]|nr:hypothetical protein [Vicinamibacterales bacterium]
MRCAGVLIALALGLAPRPAAAAQSTITTSDIQRLQDTIYDAAGDIGQLRSRDATLAADLQRELDDARDEAVYFKVKLRKNDIVSTREFSDLRARVDSIRSRAGNGVSRDRTSDRPSDRSTREGVSDSPRAPVATSGRRTGSNPDEIPAGTEFDVRLQKTLSSKTSQVEDRFEVTTLVDLRDEEGRVLVPSGSVMRGTIADVTKATRIERKGKLRVAFDRITIKGRSYPMSASVTQALESEGIAGEKEKIGIGAGAGAILGAILGGAKGALAGILIGGGGVIAATEGSDVDLPAGTILRVRLDAPLQM